MNQSEFLANSAGKIARTRCYWFWFCFSLVGARFSTWVLNFWKQVFFFAYPTLKTPFEMRSSQYHQKDNTVAFWGQQHQRPRILESKRNSYLSSKLLGSILCIKRFISSYLRFSLPISIKLNLKFDLGRCSDRPDPLFEWSSQLVTLGCNIDIESNQFNRKHTFQWRKLDSKTFCSALTETVWYLSDKPIFPSKRRILMPLSSTVEVAPQSAITLFIWKSLDPTF